MKTPEEIRDAVLAECDRHGLDFCYQCQIENGVLHRKRNGRYRVKIGHIDLHLDDDSPLVDFQSAYRILGLAERDAVAAKDAEIAELVDANATLQGHATRMETTHAATCEMLRMGNDALVAEIEGLRRAFNNNMDDMLVVVNEVKRLREGIAELKSKIGSMAWDAVTFEAAHGIFFDLRKLLADSPAPIDFPIKCACVYSFQGDLVKQCPSCKESRFLGPAPDTEAPKPLTIEEMRAYCIGWCEGQIANKTYGVWVGRIGINYEIRRWASAPSLAGVHSLDNDEAKIKCYAIIRAIERGDLGQGKEGGV